MNLMKESIMKKTISKIGVGGLAGVCLIAIVCLVFIWSGSDQDDVVYRPDQGVVRGDYPEQRNIRTVLEVVNPAPRVRKSAKVIVYVPQELNSYQLIEEQRVSHPHLLSGDALGNRKLVFDFADLEPKETFTLSIESTLRKATSVNEDPQFIRIYGGDPLNPSVSSDIEQVNQDQGRLADNAEVHPYFNDFLMDGILLQFNHEDIQEVAQALRDEDERTSFENILSWVNGEIGVKKDKEDSLNESVYIDTDSTDPLEPMGTRVKGALQVLQDREGNSWGKVLLVTALARACDIPTRPIVGYQLAQKDELTTWVEFYHQESWVIADIENRTIVSDPSEYVAARTFSDMPFQVVDKLDVLLYDYYGVLVNSVNNPRNI